jgi:4-alpha-glucanotransferase
MERSSGILLHVTSLPGAHGIGDLGPEAYQWVDRLARARQSWWQVLPLGPTGYADSPYQCYSAFAGNPALISLERLAEEGLLTATEMEHPSLTLRVGVTEVDYDRVKPLKQQATAAAYERRGARVQRSEVGGQGYEQFCREEAEWLDDYALFLALKEKNGGVAWWDWPAEQRLYGARKMAAMARELARSIELIKFRQFLFFEQWRALREYAHERGVKIIGDMPIFIAEDSADVWSKPELFQLDEDRRPTFVAGVPPDYFSATGQLWGNPLYDWEAHRKTGYAWWISRLKSTLKLVDLVRLDHFRGFEAYWAVPAGSETAEPGSWQPGPGAELFDALQAALGSLPLIAEDLGVITPPVDALRKRFELPGMRILQFAFGGAQEDRFLPHNFDQRTVVYTGTHDNETTAGWFKNLSQKERDFFERYAPDAAADPAWRMIRLAWASVAELAVAPLQDLLKLGNEARMNMPGTKQGNWRWRVDPALLTDDVFDRLADLTAIYQREAITSKS